MTHALVVVPLALRSLWLGALKDDPVFGYDPIVGNLLALSSGWVLFLFELVVVEMGLMVDTLFGILLIQHFIRRLDSSFMVRPPTPS
jgi:hypothetical protein